MYLNAIVIIIAFIIADSFNIIIIKTLSIKRVRNSRPTVTSTNVKHRNTLLSKQASKQANKQANKQE